MSGTVLAYPLPTERIDDFKAFAAEVAGPRGEAFDRSLRRCGVRREAWFVQESPAGATVLVAFDAEDPSRVLPEFAASTDEFDVWFKQRIGAITGVDLNAAPHALPDRVLDRTATHASSETA